MVEKFITSIGREDASADTITWDVAITWQQKRDLEFMEPVDAGGAVDTIAVINALWPANIVGWDRDDELTEEAFWMVPGYHRIQLAVLVATWLMSGINRSKMPEDDALPLANRQPEQPTISTPEERGCAESIAAPMTA
jgi:hypothetical protein